MSRRPVLGSAVLRAVQLGGGAVRVDLADGRTVVVKTGRPGVVAAEAAGLAWLRVAGGPPVPAVLAAQRDHLVMEIVPPGDADADAATALGRGLAALHAAGASAFGAPPPGGSAEAFIGHASMRNVPAPTWAPWYAADRVLPYLRQTYDAGDASVEEAAVIEDVCGRIGELAGPPEPPARLHGDLWTGNVLWSRDGAWLIDPAAHGGHRESDLAMLALFGCPHLDAVLAGYTAAATDGAAPLAVGWRERMPLHQLFPLLVHAVLFGRRYAEQAVGAARAALRAG